jgi:tRNA-dihydrouridine synthase A
MDKKKNLNRRFSVAPMMDCTDRHFRYLARLISKQTLLYTEMITSAALVHGDREYLLGFDVSEHPLALQLGGSKIDEMTEAAELAETYGFDEININCGCPSDRVQSGRFGACLMLEPELVAENVKALQKACNLPITIKSRIGVDENDSYEELVHFVESNAVAGCKTFIIHARKAWLSGLSPKQNRQVPPLNYQHVYRLKQDYPELEIIVNGGINSLAETAEHLNYVDGAMMGREVYRNPYILSEIDAQFYGGGGGVVTREKILQQYMEYCARQLASGTRMHHLARPVIGLFHGEPRSRLWRQYISEQAHKHSSGVEVLEQAFSRMEPLAT